MVNFWLCTTEYPPFFGGGISTYCKNTVDLFIKKKNTVNVLIYDPELKEEKLKIEKISKRLILIRFNFRDLEFYPYLGHISKLSYEFSEVIKDLLKKYKFPKPDVIEFQDYLGIGYYTLQRKYCLEEPFKNLKIITTIHSPTFLLKPINQENIYKFPEYWIGEMEKFQIIASDGIIFPSYFIKNQILSSFNKNKIGENEVIRNPYFLNTKNENKNIKKIGNYLILYGRFEIRKGFLNFLERLKKSDLQINYGIKIYGDYFFYPIFNKNSNEIINERLKSIFEKNNIQINNKVPFEKLLNEIKKARFAIFPSLFESLPYAVIEAMSLGKCVFTTPYGGQAELIENGKNGFIFDIRSQKSFDEMIKKINDLKKEEIIKIGKKAQEKIKKIIDNDQIYQKKIKFIQSLENKLEKKLFPFINEEKSLIKQETKNNTPLLSVIIPYHNMGKYIEETILSVINSNYKNKEIIIVNDGSNDSYSIAKLYLIEKKYSKSNIKILNKENGGLASARNYGAEYAKGDIIAFLDADDLVEKSYFEKAIKILNHYKNIFYVCSWTKYFEGSKDFFINYNPILPYSLIHNPMTTGSLIIKKDVFLKYGKNDSVFIYGMEDYDMLINLLKNGFFGLAIPKPYFFYRVRVDSMSKGFNYYSLNYLYNLLFNKHKEFYRKYLIGILNIINSNGPAYTFDNPNFETPFFNSYNKKNIEINNEVKRDESLIHPEFKSKLKRIIINNKVLRVLTYKISEILKKIL